MAILAGALPHCSCAASTSLSPAMPALSGIPEKHRVWGVGPEVTIPIATKSRLISLVNVRYLWETGARLKTEGQSLVVTASFPLPSISIPPKP